MNAKTTYATQTPAPAPTPAPDPKGDLAELTQQVQKNQDEIDQFSKATAAIKQDISVLAAGLGEVDQVVKAYTQAFATVGDQSGIQSFVRQQTNMVLAAIGSGKTWLDDQVSKADADIQTQTQAFADQKAASDAAAAAQSEALLIATRKQAEYDGAKGSLARVQASVGELANLKASVTAAVDAGSFGTMYILLSEMNAALKALSILKPDELQAKLTAALASLKEAKADLRKRKDAADGAAAALAAAQKKLTDTTAGRRAKLLEAVKNWKPPTAVTAAGGGVPVGSSTKA